MILKGDKGNATVILNGNDYHTKMIEHLSSGSYNKLDKDPSNRIVKTLTKAIRDSSLDDIIKRKIIPKNPFIARIYDLSKIHKDGCPLRPIVNTIGSPSYGLARLLTDKLKPLVSHSQSFIKDSSHFIQNINTMSLRESDIMVIFDVVSLYTKIPVNEVVNIIK